jgi:hypothetical protein
MARTILDDRAVDPIVLFRIRNKGKSPGGNFLFKKPVERGNRRSQPSLIGLGFARENFPRVGGRILARRRRHAFSPSALEDEIIIFGSMRGSG